MTLIVRCDDKQRLMACLYGEASADERAAVESHLAACVECAAEFAGLQDVRQHLAGWQAPEIDLGFTVTRAVVPALAAVPAPAGRSWVIPIWAQAAAAVLVLSVGAAVANLEVRYGSDGFTIRTGWNQAVPVATPSAASAAAPARGLTAAAVGSDVWKAALADTEKRLRAEFVAERVSAPQPVLARTGASGDEVLRQVRALIEESERRQQRELALRVSQVSQDVDSQRRADLVRIEQNMGQIEGVTGAEAARQRELLNYLVRVSQRR